MKLTALKKIKITLALATVLVTMYQSAPLVQALTLSPPRLEVTGEPGQLLQGELELYNEEVGERVFYTSAQNFEARGETGSPFFLPNKDTGLASWISMEETATLAGKERIKFSYTIQVPQDAEPGGYFAAIFFGTTPESPEEGGQVTIGSKVGTLVFLNVPGEAAEGAGIIEFMSEGGNIFPYLPVTLSYRFSNDGARKVMPTGEVEIDGMLGKSVAKLNPNSSQGNVLPSSIRKFSMEWMELGQDDFGSEAKEKVKEKMAANEKVGFFDAVRMQRENFAIGKYTANLDLTYGLNQDTATAEAVFYVVPWQIMSIGLGVTLIVLIVLIVGVKKYNHWLINKIKNEEEKPAEKTPVEVNTIGKSKPKEKKEKDPAKEVQEKAEESPEAEEKKE